MASEQPVPRFFLVLIYVTLAVLALVLAPVASELLIAAVFAAVLWPLQVWLSRKLGGRDSLAAGVMTLAVLLLLLGPLATLVAVILRDGASGLQYVSDTLRSARLAEMIDR